MQETGRTFWDPTTSPKKYFDGVETVCPVCYEEFDDMNRIPRSMLNCSHLLCHQCGREMNSRRIQAQPIGRVVSHLRCPICKQKGKPFLTDKVHPGDRLALALIGAVKEIDYLGKRLKTETVGMTFCKIQDILNQETKGAELSESQALPESSSEVKQAKDILDRFRSESSVEEMKRCEVARVEIREHYHKKIERKAEARVEVIICLETGTVKVVKTN